MALKRTHSKKPNRRKPRVRTAAPRRPRVVRKLLPGVKDEKSMLWQLRGNMVKENPHLKAEFKGDAFVAQVSSRRSFAVRLMRTLRKHGNIVRVDVFEPSAASSYMRHKEWHGWDECLFTTSSYTADSKKLVDTLGAASMLDTEMDRTHAVFRIEFSDDEVIAAAELILAHVRMVDVRGG